MHGKNELEMPQFEFRIWIYPEDPPDIETWCYELEPTVSLRIGIAEWARESLQCEDFESLFSIKEGEAWQVIGKGEISGSYDYYGEYDEMLDVIEFQKEPIPESHLKGSKSLIERIPLNEIDQPEDEDAE